MGGFLSIITAFGRIAASLFNRRLQITEMLSKIFDLILTENVYYVKKEGRKSKNKQKLADVFEENHISKVRILLT